MALVLLLFNLAACSGRPALHVSTRSLAAGEWPSHGGDVYAQRYSPLASINVGTAGQLGLAWWVDLDTDAGLEATPIMVGGVLYFTSAYSVVRAVDARSGQVLWTYDPHVMPFAARSCCGPVSRGVAVERGRVFVGALDGRLMALDAATGAVAWEVQTFDGAQPSAENYAITGAPRVVKGRVIIGNGGAEFGARGYVSAYDAQTGALDWRFYTVPGAPGTRDHAASDAPLARVTQTWAGDWWRWGGGGTVWDAIEYDPDLDLLYIGVGNGSPTNHMLRSRGIGDNLFLSSIVALRPETGEYVWHYQQTPGESWDYTATQPMILADLVIAGRVRQVLMQAPKNGFFYVLDRRTGELISAQPYARTTWASHIDMATGRPVENPQARYERTGIPAVVFPSSGGAHNWQPMAYSARTGLVYLAVQDFGLPFAADSAQQPQTGVYSSGLAMAGGARFSDADLDAVLSGASAYLLAWDPVAGRAAWRRPLAALFNGGALVTAGDLVFQGNGSGQFAAHDARDGSPLWTFAAQTGVVAGPITYSLDEVQYVAVLAGWGGAWPMLGGQLAEVPANAVGPNRLLVFRIGGTAQLPPVPARQPHRASIPPDNGTAEQVAQGDALYGRYCLRCHGIAAVSASMVPDLRHSAALGAPAFRTIVGDGALVSRGMPAFAAVLSAAEIEAIRSYVIQLARADSEGR